LPSPYPLLSQIDFDAQLERATRERDAAGGVKLSHKQAAYRAFASCEAEDSFEGDVSGEASSGVPAETVLVRRALRVRGMHAPNHAQAMPRRDVTDAVLLAFCCWHYVFTQAGEKLEEVEALGRLQHLASRLTEMEAWFDSVKAEAASERKIREQATARLQIMQERLERLQEQVRAQADENKLLRSRLTELRDAKPELHRRQL
jgi:hypothetical protein